MPLYENAINPLYQAARASRFQSGYQPQPTTAPSNSDDPSEIEAPKVEMRQPRHSKPSLLQQTGSVAMSGLAAAGNALDLPASSIRDTLSGKNPLDQWLDPFGRKAQENRTEGRQMLRNLGLASDVDNYGNFSAGLALEAALDPTTYLGVGVATRIGNAFKKVGISSKQLKRMTKEIAEINGKSLPVKPGRSWATQFTGKRVLDHFEHLRDSALESVMQGSGGSYKKSPTKRPFDSIDDLPEKASDGDFTIVDDGDSYKIHRYEKPKEAEGDGKWVMDEDASTKLQQRLAGTSTGGVTYKRARQAVAENYGDGIDDALAKDPLYSMISVKVPFLTDWNHIGAIKDPNTSFDKRMASAPEIKKTPPPEEATGGAVAPEPAPTSPSSPGEASAAEPQANTQAPSPNETTATAAATTQAETTPTTTSKTETPSAKSELFTKHNIDPQTPRGRAISQLIDIQPEEYTDAQIPVMDAMMNGLAKMRGENADDLWDRLIYSSAKSQKEVNKLIKEGKWDQLFQEAYHGTKARFRPERLIQLADGTEEFIDAADEVPEGASVIGEFPLGRFDLKYLGTGEGAQAYGYGLYFADDRALAEMYRTKLAGRGRELHFEGKPIEEKIRELSEKNATVASSTQETLDMHTALRAIKDRGGADFAKKHLSSRLNGLPPETKKAIQRQIDLIDRWQKEKKLSGRPGTTYKVDLKPQDDEFIYWEKPLSQQSQKVQDAAKKIGIKTESDWIDDPSQPGSMYRDQDGVTISQYKAEWVNDEAFNNLGLGNPSEDSWTYIQRKGDEFEATIESKAFPVKKQTFKTLEEAKTWGEQNLGKWFAWDSSGRQLKMFDSSEAAQKWIDEVNPLDEPTGEDIFRAASEKTEKIHNKLREKKIAELDSIKQSLSESLKDEPGSVDHIQNAIDNIALNIGNVDIFLGKALDKLAGKNPFPLPSGPKYSHEHLLKNSAVIDAAKKINEIDRELYELKKSFNAPKATAELLLENGIRGNKVPQNYLSGGNKKGKYNFVIFNDRDVEITELLQKKGTPRASIVAAGSKRIISLFEGSDFSSNLHELAHFGRAMLPEDMQQLALAGVREILGKKKPALTKGKWTRAAEEVFAKEFENYLTRGKAPTEKLKSVFEKVKEFMLDVYKNLKGQDININPKLEEVFDRMLGKEPLGNLAPVENAAQKTANVIKDVPSKIKNILSTVDRLRKSRGLAPLTDAERNAATQNLIKRDEEISKLPTAQERSDALEDEIESLAPRAKERPNPISNAASQTTAPPAQPQTTALIRTGSQPTGPSAEELLSSAQSRLDAIQERVNPLVEKTRPEAETIAPPTTSLIRLGREATGPSAEELLSSAQSRLDDIQKRVNPLVEKTRPAETPIVEPPVEQADAAPTTALTTLGKEATGPTADEMLDSVQATLDSVKARVDEMDRQKTIEVPDDIKVEPKVAAEEKNPILQKAKSGDTVSQETAPASSASEVTERLTEKQKKQAYITNLLKTELPSLMERTFEMVKAGTISSHRAISDTLDGLLEANDIRLSDKSYNDILAAVNKKYLPMMEVKPTTATVETISDAARNFVGSPEVMEIIERVTSKYKKLGATEKGKKLVDVSAKDEIGQQVAFKLMQYMTKNPNMETTRIAGWIKTAARNVVIDMYNRRSASDVSGESLEEFAQAVSRNSEEYNSLLSDTLKAFPGRTGEIIRANLGLGVTAESYEQIAKRLGTTAAAVGKEVSRAKKQMTELLSLKSEIEVAEEAGDIEKVNALRIKYESSVTTEQRKLSIRAADTLMQGPVPDPAEAAMAPALKGAVQEAASKSPKAGDKDWLNQWLDTLDRGENLLLGNPVTRQLTRLFQRKTFGGYTEKEQAIAEARYEAHQKAIYNSRALLTGVVRAIGETKFLNEESLTQQFISQGFKRKEAYEKALEEINERHQDIVAFLEGTEGRSALPSKHFPDEATRVYVEDQLRIINKMMSDRLRQEVLAGLSTVPLRDKFAKNYVPRTQSRMGISGGVKESGEKLYNTRQDSQRTRRAITKNLPGGQAIINKLSLDKRISGVYFKQDFLGDKVDDLNKIVETIKKDYGPEVLDPEIHFDEAGKLNKKGQAHLKRLGKFVATMDPRHAETQMPYYGRNVLHDIMQRIEEGITRESIALAAQDLAVDSIRMADGQTVAVTKFFEDIGLDNAAAYMNVIEAAKKLDDYNAFKAEKIEKTLEKMKKGDLIEVDDGHLAMDADTGEIMLKTVDEEGEDVFEAFEGSIEDVIEKKLNLPKSFSKDLGVSKEAYDGATRFLRPNSQRQEISEMQRMFRSFLSFFKAHSTLPWPAFLGRNLSSGIVMNYIYDAYDPTGTLAGRYTKPIKQAWNLRSGKVVKDLYTELPGNIQEEIKRSYGLLQPDGTYGWKKNMSPDEAATRWLQDTVFKYGITGDKQGYAAEDAWQSASTLSSQMPGLEVPKGPLGIMRPISNGTHWLDMVNPAHIEGGGRPVRVPIDNTTSGQMVAKANPQQKRWAWQKYEDTTFLPMRIGQDGARLAEDILRISPMLAFMKQGMLPEEAAKMVNRIQFDYSDISEFEKNLRNFVPFYTFSRKALTLTLGDLVFNPGGKQAWMVRASNRAQKREEAPDNVLRSTAIPLGETETGASSYITGLGLPYEDALSFSGIATGDMQGFGSEIFSRLRPEAQTLGELATGRSLFFDKPLSDLDPPLGRLASNLKYWATGEQTEGKAEAISPGLEYLISKSPASRYLASANQLTDTRKGIANKLLGFTTGVKITDVEPWQKDRLAIDRAAQQLKGLGGRIMEVPTMPDYAMERLPPDQQEQAQALQSFIRETQKASRERKKKAEALKAAIETKDEVESL